MSAHRAWVAFQWTLWNVFLQIGAILFVGKHLLKMAPDIMYDYLGLFLIIFIPFMFYWFYQLTPEKKKKR